MDLSKYPLDKLLYVVGARIVPGVTALLIFGLAGPHSFAWFFSLAFLGYRTKIVIALVVALLIGSSIVRMVSFVLGAIGGASVQAGISLRMHTTLLLGEIRPGAQRCSRALREPPKDTLLWAAWFWNQKVAAIDSLPEPERPLARTRLELEKLANQAEDAEWFRWYQHYHRLVLAPRDEDFLFHVQRGLHFNLQAAAVYVLVSMWFVPTIRVWWCVLLSCFWTVTLLAEEAVGVRNALNWWFSLDQQITHPPSSGARLLPRPRRHKRSTLSRPSISPGPVCPPRGLGRQAPAGSGGARGFGVAVVVGVGGVGFFGRRLRKGGAAGSGLGGCPPECRVGCRDASWGNRPSSPRP